MTLRSVRNARAGLSLAEALIVLVISSLVLSVLLPISGRAVRDNLKLGARGLNVQELSLQEDVFRTLVAGAVQPPTPPGSPPIATTIIGDERSIHVTAVVPGGSGCTDASAPTEVSLRIEQSAQGQMLVCESGERAVELMAFGEDGEAALSYSEDGVQWRQVWPSQAPSAVLDEVMLDESGQNAALLDAPLVRLSFNLGTQRIAWIERAGRAALLAYPSEAEMYAQGEP